jgi:hypothetical protein
MNLQAYANHRKALGLRGASHVAVLNAINDGRLSEPAVRREGRNWVIDPALADAQWAARTDPGEQGAMGIGTATQPRHATAKAVAVAAPPPPATNGGPSLAVSKQVKAAYEAKLTELEYKERTGELLPSREVRTQAFATGRAVRDGMMGIADRLSPQLAAINDTREVHALLIEEIRVALRVLADG